MAAAVAGAAASASSSTQKTYSQARSRLGRDSSLPMFRSSGGQDLEAAHERARFVGDGQHERRAMPVVRGRPMRGRGADRASEVRSSQDEEARPVLRHGLDLGGQDGQAEARRRAWREDGSGTTFLAIRDELAGAGRVVGRQQAPRPRPEEGLGLTERLDVGVDALDRLEALTGQGGEAQVDRHDDLADDDEVVLEEQVVRLPDRALDDVLDGHARRARWAPRPGRRRGADPPRRPRRPRGTPARAPAGPRHRWPARHPRRRHLAPRNTRTWSWHPESSGAGGRDGRPAGGSHAASRASSRRPR